MTRREHPPLRLAAALVALLGATLAGSAPAHAADCASLNLPKPVYGLGGSATKPLIGRLATALAKQADPITVLYQAPGACLGIYGILQDKKLAGSISYWDATGAEKTCDLPAINGPLVDFAVMVNSAKLCADAPATLPATIGDFQGPVDSFNLFVPLSSPADSISAEATYFVYGFGKAGQVDPWTVDDTYLIRRDQNSAAQLYIGLAAGIPPTKFLGVDAKTNSESVRLTATAATARGAIGFASGSVYDAARAQVKALAFQAKGQTCGWLPDSSLSSFDKKNVRDGRYFIWGAQHFFVRVDATTKEYTNPNVKAAIGLLTGQVAPPAEIDLLKLIVDSGSTPKCAMKVQRDGDLTDIKPYADPAPCGCQFEKLATKVATPPGCTVCTTDAQCSGATPKCRFGFCEAR